MKYICLSLLLISSIGSYAQSYKKMAAGIAETVGSNTVELQFYDEGIVRIIKSPKDHPYTKKSLSVIAAPKKVAFTVKEQNKLIALASKALVVSLNTSSGELQFKTVAGSPLLQEKPNGVKFMPFNDAGTSTYSVRQSFILDADEAIYGLGRQQRGSIRPANRAVYRCYRQSSDSKRNDDR